MIRTLYTVDDQVDRLMRHLQATGELANTLVLFTSDNGYLLGEHKATSKFLSYRKAVEVPFLLRWPGRVAAGAVDDRLVTHVDVVPTNPGRHRRRSGPRHP
jgi:N-acetylglucosamine-6-sulfatase